MSPVVKLLSCASFAFACTLQAQDLSSVLMQSTFRVSGPSSSPGKITYGSGFIVGKPDASNPGHDFYVFVTAAHVLSGIVGQNMTLTLRVQNVDGTYKSMPVNYRIRDDFKTYYKVSVETDLAVAFIAIPRQFKPQFVEIEAFSTDEILKSMNLHPGDSLFALGFPLFSDLNTFPVLRSGVLASYPVTPMSQIKRYFLNFKVLPGNSGGPVFYDYHIRDTPDGGDAMGRWIGILGVVTESVNSDADGDAEPLDIATVIPSLYVRNVIDSLGTTQDLAKTMIPRGGK